MTRGDVLWDRPGDLLSASLRVERDKPMPEIVLCIAGGGGRFRDEVHLSRREAQALSEALAKWLAPEAAASTTFREQYDLLRKIEEVRRLADRLDRDADNKERDWVSRNGARFCANRIREVLD